MGRLVQKPDTTSKVLDAYETPTRSYSDIVSTLQDASHVDQFSQLLVSPELSKMQSSETVSYTHLTLPTNREV